MKENIRNFAIISHIDHGKSTLADRFLELSGSVEAKKMHPQFLDMMDLEQEKGITIKLQPVRMEFEIENSKYILNMIDTPGHIDFNYEVSRSLAAIEGVVLLVDVLKGIQAQTLMNLDLAQKEKLVIIPVINKIDLIKEDPDRIGEISTEIANLLKINKEEIIKISAKQGTNVSQVLREIVKKVPEPEIELNKPLKCLIFDFQYDVFQGVIAYIRVISGRLAKGDEVFLINSKTKAKAKDLGSFKPERFSQKELLAGEIGYIVLGIKEPEKVKIGDTIISSREEGNIKPLTGYKEPNPVVFVGLFCSDSDDWSLLREGLSKLKLNDPSLSFKPELKSAFGRGFRCGFLGLLHAEIVVERLRREFNLEVMTSAPSICYQIINTNGQKETICSVIDWTEESKIKQTLEQYCEIRIVSPIKFLGKVLELLEGLKPEIIHISTDKVLIKSEIPFREIMANFYDRLKSSTQGYASMDYRFLDWREADLVKLEIFIAGKREEAFSTIVLKQNAYKQGKAMVEKLKKVFPSQLFSVPLQAVVGGNIVARQTVSAKRKDVIAPLYGGDYSRKRKLLEKQKKGKKKLKSRGQLKIPQQVFWKMFKRE